MEEPKNHISLKERTTIIRLRIGVTLILIWWLPFWLLAPQIASILNCSTSTALTGCYIVQTCIGVIGMIIAGKPTATLIRRTPVKQAPKVFWHLIWNGKKIS